ncbi:secretin isoform X1 [Chelonia mydas]|uniref:secretin isoform X1 n=1 Tax=Chelonia mydas TaxID=8469 RepID=UPI001CA95D26|nr:secretin isoform X1 [Chelonia mydas]
MASLLTALWQLVISVVVLSQLSATLPPLERARRHADGVFNSELSKMNENAYVQKLVKSLVGLNQRSIPFLSFPKRRYQRHSDGTFTSELSKMRGNAQVQKLIKSLVGYKRSDEVDGSEGLIHTDIPRTHQTGSSYDDFCFMWLYQSFLNDSLSESDAREATQMTGQYICPASKPLTEEMKEDMSVLD